MAGSEIGQLLESLAATPRRLEALSRDLDDALLSFRSDEATWSANDILAHLRACADVWGGSILAMITQDHPTLRYVSPRTWMKKTSYPELDFHTSLQAFTQKRAELLQTLQVLKGADWSRGATFTATTRGREQTILSYVRRIVDHEGEHCEQLEALLNL
jgi:hypothetical protein